MHIGIVFENEMQEIKSIKNIELVHDLNLVFVK